MKKFSIFMALGLVALFLGSCNQAPKALTENDHELSKDLTGGPASPREP